MGIIELPITIIQQLQDLPGQDFLSVSIRLAAENAKTEAQGMRVLQEIREMARDNYPSTAGVVGESLLKTILA